MLTRLRARAIDGATMLARYLDARRERELWRETVECLADERDEAIRERDAAVSDRERMRKALDLNQRSRESSNAQDEALRRDLSVLLTGDHPPLTPQDVVGRVQAVIDERDAARAERDARIPIDIDGAQAWCEERGWWFEREDSSPLSEPWSAYRDTAAEPVLVADTYWWAVLQALVEELSEAWDSAPSPERDP